MERNELGGRRVGMPGSLVSCYSRKEGGEELTDERSGLVNILEVCCYCNAQRISVKPKIAKIASILRNDMMLRLLVIPG